MELPLHLNRWERRRPDWAAAAVAGFAGGAVLMVLELLWTAAFGDAGPWRTSQRIAAIVLGPQVMQASAFAFDFGVVATALATHYVLGIVFGIVLGFVTTGLHYDDRLQPMLGFGALFGVLLYLFDFYGMVRLFPWFAELRGWPPLAGHLAFGMSAAWFYWMLARRSGRRAGMR